MYTKVLFICTYEYKEEGEDEFMWMYMVTLSEFRR